MKEKIVFSNHQVPISVWLVCGNTGRQYRICLQIFWINSKSETKNYIGIGRSSTNGVLVDTVCLEKRICRFGWIQIIGANDNFLDHDEKPNGCLVSIAYLLIVEDNFDV